MKNVYVILGRSTGCSGRIIYWTDTVYANRQKAFDVCNEMNRQMQGHDPNYMAYVSGPILLDETEELA
jgi:hypothetical protein|nr:MAG TPA: hypothetical protein [Caudoviricetes sp.]